jgi:hypothetical protein
MLKRIHDRQQDSFLDHFQSRVQYRMWEHMYIDSPDKVGVIDIQVGQSWGGRWVKVRWWIQVGQRVVTGLTGSKLGAGVQVGKSGLMAPEPLWSKGVDGSRWVEAG